MHQFKLHTGNNTLLSAIDPRVKLLSALALLVMVLTANNRLFPLTTTTVCVSLCLFMGIRPKALLLRFAEPAFIVATIIIVKLFFTGHTPLFSLHFLGLNIAAHREGLLEGLMLASRITGAVAVVATLGFVTPFTDLMAALAWLRVPPIFIEIVLFAWRYLFLLSDDAKVIYDAQKNRLGYTGYRQGLRSFGTLAGCLVIKAFDNSRNVTTAMVQRGYDGTMPVLKHKPFRVTEVITSIGIIICMGIIWTI